MSPTMRKLVFVALLSLPGAWAADVVVEINQASVEASGGFPYVITTPGSYVLTGNLTVDDGDADGILIQTGDGVTLNLNGFVIEGNGSSGNGVSSEKQEPDPPFTHFRNIEVRNGTVRGFGIGVWLQASVIDHVRALENSGRGIFGFRSRVVHCVARDNGGDGIVGLSVIDSEATGNQGVGIRAIEVAMALRNYAAGNRGDDETQGDNSQIQIWVDIGGSLAIDNVAVAASPDDPAILFFTPEDTFRQFDESAKAGYAGNRVFGRIENGTAIGCNTINGVAICPSGAQN